MMKKPLKTTLYSVVALLGIAASGMAVAQHHGGHYGGGARFGFYFGAPLYGPAYYPYYPPVYYPPYYPPAVVAPSAPPVYIENSASQPATAPAQTQGNWWYYCNDSRAYYPYVKECPGGWQRVSPQPPNG